MIDIQILKKNNDIRVIAALYTHLESKGRGGKESEGSCPKCGGEDRFYCQFEFFACRHCHPKHGDSIEFLQWVNGLSFKEACNQLGVFQPLSTIPYQAVKPVPGPDHSKWEARAAAFAKYASDQLWNESNSPALSYLLGRGLTLDTIEKYDLGYNPKGFKDKAANWGLKKPVWIPSGIIIPSVTGGKTKNIKIRLNNGGGWRHITGGEQVLYLSDNLDSQRIAVMVESELDALSINQEVGEVAAVAICGTNAARHAKWIAKLTSCKSVIVALDADDAGDTAAEWWLDVLGKAVRLRPIGAKDANEMLQAGGGDSLRKWISSCIEPQKIRPLDLYRTAEQSTLGFNIPEKQLTHYDYE